MLCGVKGCRLRLLPDHTYMAVLHILLILSLSYLACFQPVPTRWGCPPCQASPILVAISTMWIPDWIHCRRARRHPQTQPLLSCLGRDADSAWEEDSLTEVFTNPHLLVDKDVTDAINHDDHLGTIQSSGCCVQLFGECVCHKTHDRSQNRSNSCPYILPKKVACNGWLSVGEPCSPRRCLASVDSVGGLTEPCQPSHCGCPNIPRECRPCELEPLPDLI